MQKLPCRRLILPLMALLLLLQTISPIGGALRAQQQKTSSVIQNIDWVLDGDLINITYDLNSDPDTKYSIRVEMRNEDDSAFVMQPRTISGDVGVVTEGGTGKRIVWDYRKDLDYGLEGGKYYFQLRAFRIAEPQTIKYLATGAGIVAGGLLVFLLTRKSGDEPGSSGLPGPPGRP